jgi:hypothetical protein
MVKSSFKFLSTSLCLLPIVSKVPAGPFHPDLAQKLFVVAVGIHSILCCFTPSLGLKIYGLPHKNAVLASVMQTSGTFGMCLALFFYLQVFQGMVWEQALGWATWPYVLSSFYQAVKSDGAIGYPSQNRLLPGAIDLLVFYASQTKPSWAGSLYRAFAYWDFVNGVPCLCFPEFTAKIWQFSLKQEDKGARLIVQSFGVSLLAHGIAVILLLGQSSLKDVIGGSALIMALSLVGMIVTDQFDVAGHAKGKEYGFLWILLLLCIANSLLGVVME